MPQWIQSVISFRTKWNLVVVALVNITKRSDSIRVYLSLLNGIFDKLTMLLKNNWILIQNYQKTGVTLENSLC